jgi:hypothetical protein
MTAFPRTTISPVVSPSRGTSTPSSSTTRSSPEVSNSTPWQALTRDRSLHERPSCSGLVSQKVMNGDVSVRPYAWVMVQPNSPSMRSIVAAAGGAPAVTIRTPRRASLRCCSGPLAIPIKTVGAAHSMVTDSCLIFSKILPASTLRRQMWAPPTAVTIQTKVQPLA